MEAVDELLGFHGGVSQQDVSLRLPTQVEESINCYHTVESGLRKRNPVEKLIIDTGVSGNAFVYSYDRGLSDVSNEKYSVVIQPVDGDVDNVEMKVVDIVTKEIHAVETPSGGTPDFAYLEPFRSDTGYSASTVKDTTYITNRNKRVDWSGDSEDITDTRPKEGFLWLKREEPIDGYEFTIKLTRADTDAYLNFTISMSDSEDEFSTTTTLAKAIVQYINLGTSATGPDYVISDESGSTNYFDAECDGNIVKITSSDPSHDLVAIDISDTYGNNASSAIFLKVDDESYLPDRMPYLAKIEIGGTSVSDKSYWLQSTGLRWEETIGEETIIRYSPDTMPHKLVAETQPDGTIKFIYEAIEWTDREVGDTDNSKIPSFFGSLIVDTFFFKNRLGFLTPNSVVFSETGQYYNFWKTTQAAVLDSDRIDADIDARKALRLHYIEFLQNDIIIFGDKSQFKVSHDGALTPTSISATMISAYDVNTKVRPLGTADSIYFMAPNGDHNAMYVYTVDNISEISQANSVTEHVPNYIDGGVTQITGSSVNNVIFLRSETNKNTIYVYKYLKDGPKLLQSAWFRWEFDSEIHSIFSTESDLYIFGSWEDPDTQIVESSLGQMKIYPQDLDKAFKDGFTDTVEGQAYESKVILSRYLPRMGNTTAISYKVNLKTILVNASPESHFELGIRNTARDTKRIISEEYVLNRKPYIMGKAADTEITISSSTDDGFEINGVAIEARINNRSNSI